jgi:Raf kinase inhibitor-like YbhB/YbcL family protein
MRRFAALLLVCCAACSGGSVLDVDAPPSIAVQSPGVVDGSLMPRFTCDAEGVSPPIGWREGPKAQEYALIVTDPDAPGGEFVHWVVTGIPGSVQVMGEGRIAQGATEGTNDFGDVGYGPPCPPEGDPAHHYVFTIYALGRAPEGGIPAASTAGRVLDAIKCCIIAEGELTGTYRRA